MRIFTIVFRGGQRKAQRNPTADSIEKKHTRLKMRCPTDVFWICNFMTTGSDPNNNNSDQQRKLRRIIAQYQARKKSGQNVDHASLLHAFPDLAAQLQQLFDSEDPDGAFAATKLEQDRVLPNPRDTLDPAAQTVDTASEFTVRKFGRYQLLRPLGEGAMGSVYLAMDTLLDRQVALKMPKASAIESKESLARFTREAKAAAGLRHTNICSVYDAGEIDGIAYITMDFIDGVPLSKLIGTPTLSSVKTVLNIIRVIADAVRHAHESGIIHRDLKPGNILVDAQLNPYVTDFGLARRIVPSASTRMTHDGLLIGTPAYMSPEQVRGEQEKVGVCSDIYSLGVVFFEMLVGRLPFSGSLPELLAKVLRDQPPVPSRLVPTLIEDFDDVVLKMLKKEPSKRYASMQDVIIAVDQLANRWQPQEASNRIPAVIHGHADYNTVDGTKAASPSPLEIRKAHIELMISKGQYASAITDLELLAAQQGPRAKAVAGWARQRLPGVKAEAKAMSPAGLAAMLQTAQQLFQKYDYLGCIQLLDDVPALRRTQEMETLLTKARQRESDAELLLEEIRDKEHRQIAEGLEPLVKKFLRLKPGNTYAKRLLQALQTYSRMPATRRHYTFDRGRLQPMPEPSLLKQWGLLALLTAVLTFLSVYYYTIIYLNSGEQTLQVEVDDEWLKQQGGRLTLSIDGRDHTLTIPDGTGESLSIVVSLGEHEFAVRHGETVVHNPRAFEIRKDGRAVLQITATEMRLVTSGQRLPPGTGNSDFARGKGSGIKNDDAFSQASGPAGPATPADSTPAASTPAASGGEQAPNPLATERQLLSLPQFSLLYSASAKDVLQWSQTLPDGFGLMHMALRANDTNAVFDAVAVRDFYYDKHPTRLGIFAERENPQSALFNSHRPLFMIHYQDGNVIRKLCAGIKDGKLWSSHGPDDQTISETITAGMKGWNDVPQCMDSRHWQLKGKYLIIRAPDKRFSSIEWMAPTLLSSMPQQLAAARDRGMRPYQILPLNDRSPEPKLYTFLVNDAVGTSWSTSIGLPIAELVPLARAVASRGGQPVSISSITTDQGVLYNVIWEDINQADLLAAAKDPAASAFMPGDASAREGLLPSVGSASSTAPVPVRSPLNAEVVRQQQAAWADHLKVPVEYTNSIGMKFRLIPPGTFTIGSTADQIAAAEGAGPDFRAGEENRKQQLRSESPQRQVTISKPFYLGSTEVTQGQYEQVMAQRPFCFCKGGRDEFQVVGRDTTNAPAEMVTWMNTGEFCGRLTIHENLPSAYLVTADKIAMTGAGGYRLPTEAEWEFACRAGTDTVYYTGDDPDSILDVSLTRTNADGGPPRLVASAPPNPFGLYDMHGNVAEWVHDVWTSDAYQKLTDTRSIDPRIDVPLDGLRVIRGGSFYMWPIEARSANRFALAQETVWIDTGFRVAISVDAVRQLLLNAQPGG